MSIRVVIAEDNRDFASLLHQYLSGQPDIEVVGTVHNGEEALAVINAKHPDVLLLDIIMPQLDGIGVLEQLAGGLDHPKVIVLTGLGQEAMTKKIMELGADYYVVKPLNLVNLTANIRQLMGSNSQVPIRAAKSTGRSVDLDVTDIIREIGIPAHIKGYHFLRDGITMIVNDVEYLGATIKKLYPDIAQKHSTTTSRVERAIRHAIEVAWRRGNRDMINTIFGSAIQADKNRPTNAEFMAMIADKIRMERKTG
jgi:two-component system, response regulator, stage 0 sporulation protein A